ncbi:MAG: NAD(P)H-dependent oxidoreductase subunit E [Bacteroidota bacterium]
MTEVSKLIEGFAARQKGLLVPVLENIQNHYNYLPKEALIEVAKQLQTPLRDVYGVATFYQAFSLKPKGKHLVSVCVGTACHVRRAPIVLEEFERQLGINAGETSSDKEFTLETVNCLGACALGPIVVIDGEYSPSVKTVDAKKIIQKTKAGFEKKDFKGDKRYFPVQVNCPSCNHSLMKPEHIIDNYPCIHVTVSFGREHGWYRLTSLYGSSNFESEFEIPLDTEMNIFCPHCHAELTGGSDCPECGAKMFPMIVRGGGTVQMCPVRGCKGHILDVG